MIDANRPCQTMAAMRSEYVEEMAQSRNAPVRMDTAGSAQKSPLPSPVDRRRFILCTTLRNPPPAVLTRINAKSHRKTTQHKPWRVRCFDEGGKEMWRLAELTARKRKRQIRFTSRAMSAAADA
jgi:hypothetical protein